MWFLIVIFLLSVIGIVGLFALKDWEAKQGRTLAPSLRESADMRALQLKELLGALQQDLQNVPPELVHVSRIVVHEVVLRAAASLRSLERKAHDLADAVSHKHRFERRAPRSEFLRRVSESKNGNGDMHSENDTTRV